MSNVPIRLGDFALPWFQLRGRGATLVTANDTALDLTSEGGNWASKPVAPTWWPEDKVFNCVPAVAVNVPEVSGGRIRTVEIIAYGTSAANQSFVWTLYAYRSLYSPARRVATGTAILGTMDTDEDPVTNADLTAFYVDTFGITRDSWGSVSVKDDADNALSVLQFDLRGYQFLFWEIPSIVADTAASVGVAFSGV